MKRKIKHLFILTLLIAVCLQSVACVSAPEGDTITSKNDGSFDASVTEENPNDGNSLGEQPVVYQSTFLSTDCSVQYSILLNKVNLYDGNLPVIRVQPHSFTVDEVKRIYNVLFENATAYERTENRQMTKSEIEEKLVLWKLYQSDTYLQQLFGNDEKTIELYKEIITSFIDKYSDGSLYSAAPGESQRELCDWTFRNDGSGNDEIRATVETEDIKYCYSVMNREQDDYRIHNIFVYISDEIVSPNNIDYYITMNKLCDEAKPTQSQLEDIKQKADDIIKQIGIGTWEIDKCEINTQYISSDKEVYYIAVSATPVFNGISVTRVPQLDNLKSEETYASNYYYSTINLCFSCEGKLISMDFISPVDVVDTINDNVNTLTVDELFHKVEEQLCLYDSSNYYVFASQKEDGVVQVIADEIELGMMRIKVKDSKTDFYFVPTITVKGCYSVYNENNEIIFDSITVNGERTTLLVLNAVDGSVINVTNGY